MRRFLSVAVAGAVALTASSAFATGYNDAQRAGLPTECRDMVGRALSLCIMRVSTHSTGGSSASSVSSRSTPSVSATSSGSVKGLGALFGANWSNLSETEALRNLCMIIVGSPSSTCMQGSNIGTFNAAMHQWFNNFAATLRTFMKNANHNDTKGNYFWNSSVSSSSSSTSSSTSMSSSSSSNWWQNLSSSMNSSQNSSSTSRVSGGQLQKDAWAACADRKDQRSKVLCVSRYLGDHAAN